MRRNEDTLSSVTDMLQFRSYFCIMIQVIPAGVNKTTTARSLQTTYTEVSKELEENPETVIGVQRKKKFEFIILSPSKFASLRRLAQEAEIARLETLTEEAIKNYKEGNYSELDNKWLEGHWKRLGEKK